MKENEIMAVGLAVIAIALLFMQQQRIQPEAFIGQGQLRYLDAHTELGRTKWCIYEPTLQLFNPTNEVLNIISRSSYYDFSEFYLVATSPLGPTDISLGGEPAKLMRKLADGTIMEITPGMKIGSSEISVVPRNRDYGKDYTVGVSGCIVGNIDPPDPSQIPTTTISLFPTTTTIIIATTTTSITTATTMATITTSTTSTLALFPTTTSVSTTLPVMTTTTIIFQIPQPPQTDVFIAIQDIIQSIIDFIRSFLPV